MNKKIKELAEQYASEMVEEQKELLKTLGVIPAPSHQEDMRAAFCRDWFLKQGAEDVCIDEAKNVICRLGDKDAEELIVFAAHTDIVFPDTTQLPLREENGRLYAPGIGDDTSNLVNLMLGAKYVIKNNLKPKYGILFVANACEEGLGNLEGTKALFADYGSKIKAFYSFDGYTPQCCSSAVGSYRYRITCKTKGGHSYINFGDPNALEILCDLTERLYKIEPPKKAYTTYNIGRMEGGTTVNSVAQEAYMLYEFRSTSQECLEEMECRFNAAVESVRGRGGEIQVELMGVRPGNGPVDVDALQKFTAHTADVIGTWYHDEIDFDAYSTDSNVPLSLGILANTVGTVRGALAHTREEWIDISSLPDGLKIALSLMLEYVEL
ncbi:M20/M25/M40 family metallo-hydrolase [Clostridiaceae bacterium AM27-36LB]|nr:M20/M25/M40 family metallo-hydrolase [Clostridiaceae bacterium AM27-36LB]